MSTVSSRPDRLALLLALGLAGLGLVGAVIAWRISEIGNAVDDLARDGLAASRERAAAVLRAETEITVSKTSWLEFELARRRAVELESRDYDLEAYRSDKAASAWWWRVPAAYLDDEEGYDEARHRESMLREEASRQDLDPDPHLAEAARLEARSTELGYLGVFAALALPLLTGAEITAGRRRTILAVAGLAILGGATAGLVVLWA